LVKVLAIALSVIFLIGHANVIGSGLYFLLLEMF
jgi:hypothetical protein